MSDDNEVKIKITALPSGFGDVTTGLDKMRQQMASQAALIKQQYNEMAGAVKDATTANEAYDVAVAALVQNSKEASDALRKQKEAQDALAAAQQLQKNQATLQTVGDLEAQKLKEVTQAQEEATAANQHAIEVRRTLSGTVLEGIAKLEGKSFEQTTAFIEQGNDAIVQYTLSLAALAIVVTTTMKLLKAAFDVGEEGAQFERLQESGAKLAATFGVDLPRAVEQLKAASQDTITSQQAMIDTNKALLLGAVNNVQDLTDLMEVAATNGRALGINAQDAFTQIITGVGNLSTRLLAGIGIVVNDQQAYEAYAKTLNTTASALDGEQKRQALVNAILLDYNQKIKDAGGLTDDAASGYERFTTHITDASVALKAHISDALDPFIKDLDAVLFAEQQLMPTMAQENDFLLKNSNSYKEYKDRLQGVATVYGLVIRENGDLVNANGALNGSMDKTVATNFQMTQSQYDLAHATQEVDNGIQFEIKRLKDLDDAQQAVQDGTKQFTEQLAKLEETSDKFSLQDAGKLAIEFAQDIKLPQDQIDKLAVSMGVADQGFVDFKNALDALPASAKTSGDAIAKLWEKFILPTQERGLSDKLNADLAKIQTDFSNAMSALGTDTARRRLDQDIAYGRKKEDIATTEARKLEDLQTELAGKGEDLAKAHNNKLADIETQHQRQIDQIMSRYELSRLKALIDLDGRALFEAKAQRDADLANANKDAQNKKDDENKNYDQSLKDLADYQEEKRRQIAVNTQRARDDAAKADAQARQDIQLANSQKLTDIVNAYNTQSKTVHDQYVTDYNALTAQTKKIEKAYQDSYDTRVGDMLDFFKTNQNILQQLQSGTVSIDAVLQQWNQAQGIPFGGIPWNPGSVPHSCPSGCHWVASKNDCIDSKTGEPCGHGTNGPSGSSDSSISETSGGANVQNIKVTLEIVSDGSALGNMVKQSVVNTVWDIIN